MPPVTYLSATPPVIDLGVTNYTRRMAALSALTGWWSLYAPFATLDAGKVASMAPRVGSQALARLDGTTGPVLGQFSGLEGAGFTANVAGDQLASPLGLIPNNTSAVFLCYDDEQEYGNNRSIGGFGDDLTVAYARRAGGRWACRGGTDTVRFDSPGFRLVALEQIGTTSRMQVWSKTQTGTLVSGAYTASFLPNPGRLYLGAPGTSTGDWTSGLMEVWLLTGSVIDNAPALSLIRDYAKRIYFDAQ